MKINSKSLAQISPFSRVIGTALGGTVLVALIGGILVIIGNLLPMIVLGFAIAAPIQRSALNWLFFNNEPFIKSRDYRCIFLVSDAYEYHLQNQLYRGIYSILVPGTIWTAGSLALLLIALKLLGKV